MRMSVPLGCGPRYLDPSEVDMKLMSSTKQWLWYALNGVRQYKSCTANAIEEALHIWFLKVLEKLRKRQNEVLFIVH